MKKNIKYIILFLVVISICLTAILMLNNGKLSTDKTGITAQSNTMVPSKNEANEMTDEQLVEKITSGEETLSIDNIEDDTILTNIDALLSEKDPLADMPGE